jgi:uracil-DNA glycosylase
MTIATNLLFSKFQPQEFEQLCQLLCSVFETSPKELAKLYQDIDSTFYQPGWPKHFVRRDFFKSASEPFRHTCQKSPVIAVDLPSLIELDDGQNYKSTIALIGQDPKNNEDQEQLVVGTPYGLHHQGSREELSRTKLYFEMVHVLLELGYRVYMTDLLKIWVCNPEQRYVGLKLPASDQQRFLSLVKLELDVLHPVSIITWGKKAASAVDQLKSGIKHLKFPHPSGAASGKWQELMQQSPTHCNKLAYFRTQTTQFLCNSLLPRS